MNDTRNTDERRQELLLLGQIHGLVQSLKDGQDLQNRRMDRMEQRMEAHYNGLDARLREVEKKAAVAGALSGGMVAVGTALAVEAVRYLLQPGLGG